MKLIHKRDLKFQEKIGYSIWSPIIGSLFILPWGYFIFTFMRVELPNFIFIINCLIYPLFLGILLKQYKQILNPNKKFLLAVNNSNVILPLNHGIKDPDDNLNYFLEINLSKDVKNFEIMKSAITLPILNRNQRNRSSTTKHHLYLLFELKDAVEEGIVQKHKKISSATGFTGSPVVIKGQDVEYHFEDSRSKLPHVSKLFSKKGIFSGKVKVHKENQIENFNWDNSLNEIDRLKSLGKDLEVNYFIKYLLKKGKISEEQKNYLKENYSRKSRRSKKERLLNRKS